MIDIAIIGGGPAGLAAGLYASRGGANAVLFEELFAGGQAAQTAQIDNYPGFPEGIAGGELGMRFEQQAKRFGLILKNETVRELELSGPVKKIVAGKETIEARAVIICTGASPRRLGLAREDALEGMGISYCATCDGAFFKDKDVAVVGGGDTALSDALYLARFAGKVTLIHRRDALRGSPALQRAVFAEENIEICWNHVVEGLEGETALTGLLLSDTQTGEQSNIPVSALFVAVGIEPRTSLVQELLPCSPAGYILTDAHMRTALPGVFAAGDARETPLRQVVTAVADGAIAAEQALDYLTRLEKKA